MKAQFILINLIMGNCYYFLHSGAGVMCPRFWIRTSIAFLVAMEVFWYTGSFGADFASLFSQDLAGIKFLLCTVGSVAVGEWIFYTCMLIFPKIDVIFHRMRFFAVLVAVGIVASFLLLFAFGQIFGLLFGQVINNYVSSINLLPLFLIIANFIMIYMAVFMAQYGKYIHHLEVYYGTQLVKLKVNDIAYLFYHEGTFFITSHKAISYEVSLEESIEEFNELLDPRYFFMINDFTIISRKGCKKYVEDENGQITVTLVPKPILPKPLRDKNDPELYDFINYN